MPIGHDKNWLEPTRSKIAEDLIPVDLKWPPFYAHFNTSACEVTYRCQDSSEANHKRPKSGGGPIPGNPCSFPKTVGILFSLISL